MAYTQDDLNIIDQAIKSLAAGEKIESVSFSNGESIKYGQVTLSELQKLRTQMQNELGSASGKKF